MTHKGEKSVIFTIGSFGDFFKTGYSTEIFISYNILNLEVKTLVRF